VPSFINGLSRNIILGTRRKKLWSGRMGVTSEVAEDERNCIALHESGSRCRIRLGSRKERTDKGFALKLVGIGRWIEVLSLEMASMVLQYY
jgi:hypothetical protein